MGYGCTVSCSDYRVRCEPQRVMPWLCCPDSSPLSSASSSSAFPLLCAVFFLSRDVISLATRRLPTRSWFISCTESSALLNDTQSVVSALLAVLVRILNDTQSVVSV